MSSIESQIKAQYTKFFVKKDWHTFKTVADYYLKTAAQLKKKDITGEKSLLIRNIQKRLFIGIGCELLLKAFYLNEGYCINKPVNRRNDRRNWRPSRFNQIARADYETDYTCTMNELIDNLGKIHTFKENKLVIQGFKIAKVFRNKEGHIVVFRHEFDPQNYTDIEMALTEFYREAFSQKLIIEISMKPNQKGLFKITKI